MNSNSNHFDNLQYYVFNTVVTVSSYLFHNQIFSSYVLSEPLLVINLFHTIKTTAS